jgi:hypothetical protein
MRRRSKAGDHFLWRQPLGRPECPFSYRWVFPLGWRGQFGSIRIHQWIRSDDARACHDHANDFLTIVLWGSYRDIEERAVGQGNAELVWTLKDRLTVGSVRFRRAEHRHRVEVAPGGCWTLLWMSPPRKDWGYFWRDAASGRFKYIVQRHWFKAMGHHPCDQP